MSQKKNQGSVGTWKDARQGKRQLPEGGAESCVLQRKLGV